LVLRFVVFVEAAPVVVVSRVVVELPEP